MEAGGGGVALVDATPGTKASRGGSNLDRHMTPWDRRAETKSARARRLEKEAEAERQRMEELRKEKDNAIEQFMVSAAPPRPPIVHPSSFGRPPTALLSSIHRSFIVHPSSLRLLSVVLSSSTHRLFIIHPLWHHHHHFLYPSPLHRPSLVRSSSPIAPSSSTLVRSSSTHRPPVVRSSSTIFPSSSTPRPFVLPIVPSSSTPCPFVVHPSSLYRPPLIRSSSTHRPFIVHPSSVRRPPITPSSYIYCVFIVRLPFFHCPSIVPSSERYVAGTGHRGHRHSAAPPAPTPSKPLCRKPRTIRPSLFKVASWILMCQAPHNLQQVEIYLCILR